jgi:hypothetical protein
MALNNSPMGRYRAIMTDTDRENIVADPDDDDDRQYVDQSVYRVRQRISEELTEDVKILQEHRPDLLEELREVVCDDAE